MATETQAAPSPAEEQDPFNGIAPTLTEWNKYRQSGDVPERFKAEPAEPAPAAEPAEGEKPENEPETAPDNEQEPPEGIGNKARRRFEKLLAEKKDLERKLAQQAKPDEKPAPSAAPQTQQIAPTRQKPTLADKNDDGTLKYSDYATFVEDLGTWSAEQTLHKARVAELQQKQSEQIQENIETARRRYGDEFDEVIEPTAGAIMGNASIPVEVKRMMAQSDVLPELVYTIGTDQKTMKELERLAKANPSQAIRYIATLEVGIREELAAEPEPKETPEPKKSTAAPKPPAPVNGPSSRAFDVSDDSLSPEEWARKRNAQLARQGRR
jgi:hypothetical protein